MSAQKPCAFSRSIIGSAHWTNFEKVGFSAVKAKGCTVTSRRSFSSSTSSLRVNRSTEPSGFWTVTTSKTKSHKVLSCVSCSSYDDEGGAGRYGGKHRCDVSDECGAWAIGSQFEVVLDAHARDELGGVRGRPHGRSARTPGAAEDWSTGGQRTGQNSLYLSCVVGATNICEDSCNTAAISNTNSCNMTSDSSGRGKDLIIVSERAFAMNRTSSPRRSPLELP